jgi:hypothetical protein
VLPARQQAVGGATAAQVVLAMAAVVVVMLAAVIAVAGVAVMAVEATAGAATAVAVQAHGEPWAMEVVAWVAWGLVASVAEVLARQGHLAGRAMAHWALQGCLAVLQLVAAAVAAPCTSQGTACCMRCLPSPRPGCRPEWRWPLRTAPAP